MCWSEWRKRTGSRCRWWLGEFCMPWWKRVQVPEGMSRPDNRTEKVIERLETVAERMENVARLLASDLDKADNEQRALRAAIREAQGRGSPGAGGGESGGEHA